MIHSSFISWKCEVFSPLACAMKLTFFFRNTRLQVEHPVTEMITGLDLVEWQLEVASGNPLPLSQPNIPRIGHSFEARIYAENPANNFLPDVGPLHHLSTPKPYSSETSSLRIEEGFKQGSKIEVFYDPLIAKVVAHGRDRSEALRVLRKALEEYQVVGVHTNVEFLRRLAGDERFVGGEVETGFIQVGVVFVLMEGFTLTVGCRNIIITFSHPYANHRLRSWPKQHCTLRFASSQKPFSHIRLGLRWRSGGSAGTSTSDNSLFKPIRARARHHKLRFTSQLLHPALPACSISPLPLLRVPRLLRAFEQLWVTERMRTRRKGIKFCARLGIGRPIRLLFRNQQTWAKSYTYSTTARNQPSRSQLPHG